MFEFSGFLEFLFIACAALVLVGPKELPTVLRFLGKCLYKWRQGTEDLRRYLDTHIQEGVYDAMVHDRFQKAHAPSSDLVEENPPHDHP